MAAVSVSVQERFSLEKKYACDKLNVEWFKPKQSEAIDAALGGNDLFVCLPTGFGKSLIFQSLPLCFDVINNFVFASLAIVIVPLKSLALNQAERLKTVEIDSVVAVGGFTDEHMEEAVRGKYSFLFTSPEALFSTKGREFLQLDSVYRRICGLFIDESHCVTKWGQSSGKTSAFRKVYAQLGELRSLLKPRTIIAAMTATASLATRMAIIDALQMRNAVLIQEGPVRDNIKHVVLKTKLKDVEEIFGWLADDVNREKEKMERIIIYCQSRKTCAELYSVFCYKVPSSHHKFFNMYHTNTESDVQEEILESFSNPEGVVRILFATIAFGLGVDVKGAHNVVIFGTPSEIDDYVQLSGRVGRDGQQSLSIVINYPRNRKTPFQKQMKNFLDTPQCRRAMIHAAFPVAGSQVKEIVPHNCCDNCACNCCCGGISCSACPSYMEKNFNKKLQVPSSPVGSEVMTRSVSQEEYTSVQKGLQEMRNELVGTCKHVYTGADVACGLSTSAITKILNELSFSFSYSQFCERYEFGGNEIRKRVWAILNNSLINSSPADSAYVAQSLTDSDSSDDESYKADAAEGEYAEPCVVYSESD